MDIEALMNRPVVAFSVPSFGNRYVVTEWDDSRETVKVIRTIGDDEIEFEYPDGVRHRTSLAYFFDGMNAKLLC